MIRTLVVSFATRSRALAADLAAGAFVAAGMLSCAHLAAQVPCGWGVVSSHQNSSPPGGLTLVHSTMPGAGVPVTGLPPDLTGAGNPTTPYGAASVLIDRQGHLVVGEHTPAGQSTDIHVLTLNGAAMVIDQVYPIGTSATGNGFIDQMGWLGDDIVFAVRGQAFTSGPFASQLVGILRPGPGTVAPVPITFLPPGTINALAVDASAGLAYFAMDMAVPGASDIYSVPVPGSGAAVAPGFVVRVNASVRSLGMTNNGRILVGGNQGGTTYLCEIDQKSNPPTVTPLPTGALGVINGLAVETATGAVLVADRTFLSAARLSGGVSTTLTPISGIANGVAIRPALETYGTATGCGTSYGWRITPNPGGLPVVGNTGFSITIDLPPGTAPGVLLGLGIGFGETQQPLPQFGVVLLLAPPVALQLLPAQGSVTAPLPVPANPALAGLSVFAQSAHFQPCGIAASNGLRIGLF